MTRFMLSGLALPESNTSKKATGYAVAFFIGGKFPVSGDIRKGYRKYRHFLAGGGFTYRLK